MHFIHWWILIMYVKDYTANISDQNSVNHMSVYGLIYIYMHINAYVCIYNLSAQVGCETRSFIKQNLTGMNPEFSFS